MGGAIVVIGVIWSVLGWSGSTNASDSQRQGNGSVVEWFEVKLARFDVKVIASGELEARNQIEVKSKVSGQPVILSVIDEGKRVKEGDVLCKLDDEDITTHIEEETLNVEKARAEKTSAERDLELADQEAANDAKAAEVKLLLAELELEKWRNGDVKQKRRTLDLALLKAERKLERAQLDVELSSELREQKFISQNELDDSELAAIEALEALETAKLDIKIYNQYIFKREQKQRTSDVDQATVSLERTLRQNEIRLSRHHANVGSKSRTLELRQERLDEYEEQLTNTVVYAPSDGLVVYATSVGRGRNRGNPIAPGREVRHDETIFLLPDTSQMVASMRVHEALIPQVQIDQHVIISIDARPDSTVEGHVTSVGVMAEDGGWFNPQLREYIVKVTLPADFDESLKPAMRCNGEIFVDRVEDVLAMPIQAVFTEGDQRFCYVSNGEGRVQRKLVTIDRTSETMVEIATGLEAGDRVLMRNPEPGEVVETDSEATT